MKPPAKQRIDQLLVDRGLAESRQKAQALILAGSVLVQSAEGREAGTDRAGGRRGRSARRSCRSSAAAASSWTPR